MAKKRKTKKGRLISALARRLAIRDGANDGRYKVRVIPNKKRIAKRKACRGKVTEE